MDQVDEEHLKAVFIDLMDHLDEDDREPVREYIREQLGESALDDIEKV